MFPFLFFVTSIVYTQTEIGRFELKSLDRIDWEFKPQLTFSYNNEHFVIGTSSYTGINNDRFRVTYNDGLELLKFDNNYQFMGRFKLRLGKPHLRSFEITVTDFKKVKGNFEINLLINDDQNFYLFKGKLNLETKIIEDLDEAYKIPLSIEYHKNFVKVVKKEKIYHILQLNKKTKKLHVYSLYETNFQSLEFDLEKQFFKRLKANFGVLYQIDKKKISELDLMPGFQINVSDNAIYILTGNCVKEGASLKSLATTGNCSSDYYFPEIHLLKINLSDKTLKTKIIGKSGSRKRIAYTILDDNLFYTYYEAQKIILITFDIKTFKGRAIFINEHFFSKNNLKAEYINYNKDSSKIRQNDIDYTKFVTKFSKAPTLAVKKIDSTNKYDISLGHVKYKAYNSFGDWLGAFALANVSANLSYNASDGHAIMSLYYFNNEIPVIHKTRFETDFSGNTNGLSLNDKSSQKEIILKNLDYFLDKKMVSPIGNLNNSENRYVLLRKENKWKDFYIVKL
jgi:hypothetical protein